MKGFQRKDSKDPGVNATHVQVQFSNSEVLGSSTFKKTSLAIDCGPCHGRSGFTEAGFAKLNDNFVLLDFQFADF